MTAETNRLSHTNGSSRNGRGAQALTADVGRTLPHSVEAEQGVLGSILISPADSMADCADKITAEHFYIPAHQTLYSVLVELWDAHKAIDLITFTQVLRDRNVLESVGGAAFVTSLFTFVPTAANLPYYLEIVREKWILRAIIATGTELVRRAYDEGEDIHAFLDAAQEKITSLGLESRWVDNIRHIAAGVMDTLERFENAYKHRGQDVVSGLATGWHDIDRMLSGLKGQQFVVIAGMTSHGKSVVAANLAEHVAHHGKQAVGLWSMEMSYNENIDRIVCSVSNVSLQKLKSGMLGKEEMPRLTEHAGHLAQAPIYIDDMRGVSIQEFKAMARRAVQRHKLRLILVDYLQLMSSVTKRAQENRAREIAEITAGLKSLAKELNIPVVALAQLNREADRRASVFRRPKLSDLKESSAIEQDADTVLVIWRPIRFCENQADREKLEGLLKLEELNAKLRSRVPDHETLTVENYAELIVLKNRNGPVSKGNGVPLRFVDDVTRLENVTPKMWSNNPNERQST